jgi:hypothetical protein
MNGASLLSDLPESGLFREGISMLTNLQISGAVALALAVMGAPAGAAPQ